MIIETVVIVAKFLRQFRFGEIRKVIVINRENRYGV